MKLETLNSNKFAKFEANEISELTAGSIGGGMIATCDAKNNDDCLFELSGLDPNDLWTGTCGNGDGHYVFQAHFFSNTLPYAIKSPNPIATTVNNSNKTKRF